MYFVKIDLRKSNFIISACMNKLIFLYTHGNRLRNLPQKIVLYHLHKVKTYSV